MSAMSTLRVGLLGCGNVGAPLTQLLESNADLIARRLYLVPNSIVVSRGCPHVCDF